MGRSRAVSIGVAAVILLGVLVWAAGSAILAEGALRAPRTEIRIPDDWRRHLASLSSRWDDAELRSFDGTLLKAWFLRSKSPARGCVLLLHGIADSRRGALGPAAFLLEEGYSLLLPDIRAHGESGGDLMTYGLLESRDALAWAEWLRQSGCGRLYGFGESLGGAILIQAEARAPTFAALVAECAFSSLHRVAVERVREVVPLGAPVLVPGAMLYTRLRYGYDLGQASPEAAVRQIRAPLLLIHGHNDNRTRPHHSVRILEAGQGRVVELWQVSGAGHTGASTAAPAEFRRRVTQWFARY